MIRSYRTLYFSPKIQGFFALDLSLPSLFFDIQLFISSALS